MIKTGVPYGSDVSVGKYRCDDCGYIYTNQSKTSLPPCPRINQIPHYRHSWTILNGQGDAKIDPYPYGR